MTPLAHLHYAFGEIAYAMAGIDGRVQKVERKKFHDIVVTALKKDHTDYDISEIIFTILDRDNTDPHTAYNWAINEMRMNSHYLSPELKRDFINVARNIAIAYPPVAREERDLMNQFLNDIAPLKGDPVYFS